MRRASPCLGLPLALSLLFGGGCALHRSAPANTAAPVLYTRAAAEHLERLSVRTAELSDAERDHLLRLPRDASPFGTRSLIVQRADTMRSPPWSTRLYVMEGRDFSRAIVIECREHASYGVSHQWLNDHALFVRVWWGRIASTDAVIDLETLRLDYARDAVYSGSPSTTASTPPAAR